MKKYSKTVLAVATGAFLVAGLMCQTAKAAPIDGEIDFSGGSHVNNANLGLATAFTSIAATVTDGTGDYAVIPGSEASTLGGPGEPTGTTTVTFDQTMVFVPTTASVVPLWTLTYGGHTYSFDSTSMAYNYDSVTRTLSLSGNGNAFIDGTDSTPGQWAISVSQTGSRFSFGANTAVPDGGMTVALLGFALVGLQGLRRKLGC